MKHLVCASALVALTVPALAAAEGPEPAPAKGPADLINRARAEAAERSLATSPAARQTPTAPAPRDADTTSPTPAGDAPTVRAGDADAANPPLNPHAMNPHAAGAHAPPAPVSTHAPNPALDPGTIRVRVLDEADRPVADAAVRIGVLHADAKRSEHTARTDPGGYATFTKLPTGSQQAYRASIDFARARYGSMPFRLDEQSGEDVVLRRLPVTDDDARVVLYLGATSVELKDERVSIVQQARLLNIDSRTYVFPEGGKLVRLPRGFTAFQSQETMGDQRVTEAPEEGLRIAGSIPPGEATLVWGFDLPIDGSELEISTDVPWKTFAYRVIADAPPGLRVEVEGMPAPMVHEDGGRRFYVTEMQRRIGDDPFMRLRVRLTGIPGPGPLRWIAAGIALAALALGFVLSWRKPTATSVTAASTREQQNALLARVAELDAMRARGEVGPRYHEEQKALLVDDLAALLWEEAEARKAIAGRKDAPEPQR